jgi:hypothetical protein
LGASDNYESLKRIRWQIHVYGAADKDLWRWCEERRVPLEVFPWKEEMRHAGLRENAFYVVRPDTYVGLAGMSSAVDTIERYFAEIGLDP